jgi:hypothetical protein
MECIAQGKDETYIKIKDLVSVLQMKKPEIIAIADNLTDMSGNLLKSPTGRPLFKRAPFRFSWYGFQSVCMAARPEIGSQIMTYASEMEDFHHMLESFLMYPGTNVNLEVNGQTASSLAADGRNWKVVEDLKRNGALQNHPAFIESLALHNHLDLLNTSLLIEKKLDRESRLLTAEHLGKIFTKTCEAGHPECAARVIKHMREIGVHESGNHNLLEAVQSSQHWMIDFHIAASENFSDDDMIGQAVLTCAENGDFRSLEKLIHHKANPNYGYSSTKGNFESPLLIAGSRWAISGSDGHYSVIVCLLMNGADIRQEDREVQSSGMIDTIIVSEGWQEPRRGPQRSPSLSFLTFFNT